MWKISVKLVLSLNIYAVMLLANNAAYIGSKTSYLKVPRIVNGADASLNQSRHQVSIRLRSYEIEYGFGHGHICGGSVISKNVVLSAAHCFVNDDTGSSIPEKNFIAVMGTLDRLDYTETTLVLHITKIIIHSNFNLGLLDSDIALLVLNGEVPVKHPTVEEIFLNEGPIEANTLCQVTGWGYNEIPKLTRYLKVAQQPIIDKHECRTKSEYSYLVLDGMMCAGYLEDETKVNRGDSGGPLVCAGLQVGIVSFRSRDNVGPGVYTDVAYYKDWILKELAVYDCDLPRFATVSNNNFIDWLYSNIFKKQQKLIKNFRNNKPLNKQ